MHRAIFFLLAACTAAPQPDGGAFDAGRDAGPPDAGPPRYCVTSTCDVGGDWQVTYTHLGDSGVTYCSPPRNPLQLTSDGGSVCMLRAESGSSDGGCAFGFQVPRNGFDIAGSESWALHLVDAGLLEGSLSVVLVFPQCSADFAFSASP